MVAADNTFTATVSGVNGQTIGMQSDPTGGRPDHLVYGYATFNMGPAIGQRRSIMLAEADAIMLTSRLYVQPNPGDTFQVTFGCDKSRGDHGCAFFNNLAHFRGFPYIPPATFAI